MTTRLSSALIAFSLGLASLSANAGQPAADGKSLKTAAEPCPPSTLDWVTLRSSYTAESDFERGDNASGDSWYKMVEANHRIPIRLLNWPTIECGEWFLRVGADYRRWDFNNEGSLPLPNTLQSFSAIIALEYVIRDQTAVSIEARPGFFFENDVTGDSFDVPITAYAPLWWHEGDTFSWALMGGVSYAGHRSYPLLPALGLAVKAGKWTLLAVPPEPRLFYSATDKLTLWAGGEVAGGSFRTDSHDFERKPSLNRAVVSYSEWRAAAGFSYKLDRFTVDVGAGYAFNRKFDFHRAEEGFETDGGAPFVKVEIRAGF